MLRLYVVIRAGSFSCHVANMPYLREYNDLCSARSCSHHALSMPFQFVPLRSLCVRSLAVTSQGVDDDVGRGVDGQQEVRDVDDAVDQRRRRTLERRQVRLLRLVRASAAQVGLVLGRGGRRRRRQPAGEDFVHVRDDLDRLADDEENGDGDQDDAEVRLPLLPGRHLGLKQGVDFVSYDHRLSRVPTTFS